MALTGGDFTCQNLAGKRDYECTEIRPCSIECLNYAWQLSGDFEGVELTIVKNKQGQKCIEAVFCAHELSFVIRTEANELSNSFSKYWLLRLVANQVKGLRYDEALFNLSEDELIQDVSDRIASASYDAQRRHGGPLMVSNLNGAYYAFQTLIYKHMRKQLRNGAKGP